MIATTGVPFSFVEKRGFRGLMAITSPNYKVPCRTTFSEIYVPKLYTSVKENIRLMLRVVPFMSLTTDAWTGCNGGQFLGVTTTFIDEDWSLQTRTLACRPFNTSHTGINVAALIIDVLEDFNVNERIITSITTDRGSNMINAILTVLKKPHISCFAHVLNTFVQKVLENTFIFGTVEKIRGIYNLLAYSSAARRRLIDLQANFKLPEHKMPSSCSNRWWSEIKQMQFVIAQEAALYAFCNDGKHQHLAISCNEVKGIKVVLELMINFERIQKSLGSECNATASLIIPVIARGKTIINSMAEGKINVPGIINFREEVKLLYANLVNTYCTETSHLDLATFLDPRVERTKE